MLYELGTLLRRVDDEQLWRADGYASFTDYLERGADVARTTARRCIDVTRHFNLEVERRASLRPQPPAEVTERVERLAEALPPPPRGIRKASRRVEATRTSTGKISLTFRQIPLAELRAFVDALERELMEA